MEKENECPCIPECPCTQDCERRGDCAACFTYHLNVQTPIACKRYMVPKELEKRVHARLKAVGIPLDGGIK